jgi:hypothetical protein
VPFARRWVGYLRIALDSPFDWPLSISELALLPRKPVLLLLCPSLLVPFRISLFRVMTGVSAKGSMIRCAFGSRFFATCSSLCIGVCTPAYALFGSGCVSGAGVTCFFLSFTADALFFVRGFTTGGSVAFAVFGRTSSCSRSPDRRADRLRLPESEDSGSIAAIDFFFGRGAALAGYASAARAGFAGSSSGMGSGSGAGAACAFVVLRDVRRENWKPSSTSSYAAAFAVFFAAAILPIGVFVVAVALLLVPFTSVFGLFGAGASSSSKARFSLFRSVVGLFVAIGRDSSGERAKIVVMSTVAALFGGLMFDRQSACMGATSRQASLEREGWRWRAICMLVYL